MTSWIEALGNKTPLWWITSGRFLRLEQKVDKLMVTLADVQAKQAVTDAAVATVKTDVEALVAKIAVGLPGVLSADQQAALDDIGAHADRINTALGNVATEANPPAGGA